MAANMFHGVKLGPSSLLIFSTMMTLLLCLNGIKEIWRISFMSFMCSTWLPGLKININKSNLFGVGVSSEEVVNMAVTSGCLSISLPLSYLGLPIGSNMNRVASWKVLIDRFKNKLSASFDKGGLEVGSIKSFNISLIYKWRWCLMKNPEALWVKVIKSIHGAEAGMYSNGYQTNGLWAKIVGTINHLHLSDLVPFSSIKYKVGDGSLIRFWIDTWAGDSPLRDRFNRPISSGRSLTDYIRMLDVIGSVEVGQDSDSCSWSLSNDGVKIKGHEKQKLIKGGQKKVIEQCEKRKKDHGICRSTDHNRRTCLDKEKADEIYSVGDAPSGCDLGDGVPKDGGAGGGFATVEEIISLLDLVQDLVTGPGLIAPQIYPLNPLQALSESEDSEGGHWKSRSKGKKSRREEDDLSQPWVCEEVDPFTPRIHYFDFPKTRMPSHIKTYDESEDPKDHLKIFQAAAKIERWAMPTWCHMFNSTLTGNVRVWFDDLPPESIDSYDDLKKAFLENYLQQKKCIKDLIEIHNIKQREGESTEEFVKRYKLESRDVKGAPECMRISGFVHGITNPELIKRLHDKIPKTVDEMMRVATSFLRGEVAASNHERKKTFPPWKQHEGSQKQNFKKGGKFKAPPPMTTPVEKQNHAKFYEFHGKNNEKEQPKVVKKGETSGKEKALAILMVQPRERVARQRITQSFSLNPEILFPPLGEDEGTEGPMIIEAEIGGHCVHRMYVDGGSALEILYEHCFSRLRPKIKKQLIPATTPLIGFSGEIIWPIGQIQLLVKIGDEEHSASAWMNFMVVRSSSPYNGIIGRPGVRKLQAVPSTAHGMLKIPVEGGVITLKSSKLVPLECAVVSGPEETSSATKPIIEERVKIAINPEYPEQTVMIGSTLTEEGRNKLCGLLQRNLDIFAWKPADMTGVPRHIAEHRLNIREGCKAI
ncbi:reverse transcriptase domain-containing protein [Tanacetum coccineum]